MAASASVVRGFYGPTMERLSSALDRGCAAYGCGGEGKS